MSSAERGIPNEFRRWLLLGAATLSLAGCFQPMYGDPAITGKNVSLRDAMRDVEVTAIEGRVGQELRNDLIFELTGGAGNPTNAPYRLNMAVATNTYSAIVDPLSGLGQAETVMLDVTYRVKDIANDRFVISDTALARVTIDRTTQRYARVRAVRDAENQAAKIVAEQIRSRVASYFLMKT